MGGLCLRIVLNGKSASRDDVRQAIGSVRAEGHTVSVRVTYEAGDVERIIREALQDRSDIDVLVAAGGDGTINEVVAALIENLGADEEVPFNMGILPLGIANDFARGAGMNPADILASPKAAVSKDARPVDIGRLNNRVFVNMATGGFGAKVTVETDPKLKSLIGGAAYLFTGLQRFSELVGFKAKVRGENMSWEGEFLAMAIGNGRQAGGGIELCPDARIDDGLLDLTIIPSPKRDEVSTVLEHLVKQGLTSLRDQVINAQGAQFSIEAETPIQFNLDGEPVAGDRFDVRVEPGRLKLVV
ncbi:lipid kinase YegS [Roseibium sp. TrichSKD4]|uniref:lipid kinase YegS n=1 Tax=Roseibium sp. TrichSKD4 TaxID=744980 RepID=UPI0001E5686E|nr:lipid kinase YegS [Roseibium sp. TrichSKD4]EFO30557.1 lipid kinase YegS [Roseibium sp. TrichSKD4]